MNRCYPKVPHKIGGASMRVYVLCSTMCPGRGSRMMSLSSQNKSQQPAAYPTIESIAHPDYTVTLQATLNPQQHYAIHHTKI